MVKTRKLHCSPRINLYASSNAEVCGADTCATAKSSDRERSCLKSSDLE